MSNYSGINLQDAALFSALAYAPSTFANSVLWGLTQSGVVLQSAQLLGLSQWTDQTQALSSENQVDAYADGGLNSFRVFVKPATHQVVFAFKGSSAPTNFFSDLTSGDQGSSQYASIEPAAKKIDLSILNSPAFAGYTFFADGHSLGGGMAQTFALQIKIRGSDKIRCRSLYRLYRPTSVSCSMWSRIARCYRAATSTQSVMSPFSTQCPSHGYDKGRYHTR